MASELLLGVDGGKSKTVCLVASADGEVLGAGRAGSSDKYDVPLEQALDAVEQATRAAARQAGVDLPVQASCFGLAGADWPEDFEQLERGLRARGLAQRVVVKNDMHIALHANTDHGVVLSAGTHCAAAIRTPDGQEWHSGWYSVRGPGGVTAGDRALWAVLQAQDGRGPTTVLTGLVLAATGLSSPDDLLRKLAAEEIDDAYRARLAPLLFDAYWLHRDPVAADIIMTLGEEMASWVAGLLARFDRLDAETAVVLSGGLFKGQGSLLQDAVAMHVHARAPRAVLRPATREPVTGALIYAYEALGGPDAEGFAERIAATLPGEELFKTG
jgi:N-acetylglucosamine kinase-like BadF-type ATPase